MARWHSRSISSWASIGCGSVAYAPGRHPRGRDGLGKTIQVVALLCAITEAARRGATAMTASLTDSGGDDDDDELQAPMQHLVGGAQFDLDNWERELRTWAPSLVVAKY